MWWSDLKAHIYNRLKRQGCLHMSWGGVCVDLFTYAHRHIQFIDSASHTRSQLYTNISLSIYKYTVLSGQEQR